MAGGQPLDLGTNTLQTLTRIWTGVLGAAPVTSEQNFFEAGGNPQLAIQLCDRIHASFGYTLPPLALYTALTPLALARVLTQGTLVPFSNALLLKAGSSAPPLFLFHGIGGNVMEFFEVVQHLDWSRPIYGLQAKGSDGLEPPLESVADMAEYHLEAIRRLQPRAPYLLCGYSFGGLVALEIARHLGGSGEAGVMLTMIDSYPHERHLRASQRYESYLQRAQDRLRRALGNASPSFVSAQQSQELSERICGSATRAVTAAARTALRCYNPKLYSGKVNFVTARIKTVFPSDPAAAWRGLVGEFALETVPGAHHGMLQTSAATLAAALSRHLAGALQSLSAVGNSPNCASS